jgi:hypothetical protein
LFWSISTGPTALLALTMRNVLRCHLPSAGAVTTVLMISLGGGTGGVSAAPGLGRRDRERVRADAGAGIAAAWETLTTWARAQHADRTTRQPELDENASTLQQNVRGDMAAVIALLTEHDITDVADPARAPAAMAAHTIQAENELKDER